MDDIFEDITIDEGLIPDWEKINPYDAYHVVNLVKVMHVPKMNAAEVAGIIGILSKWKKAVSNPVEPCHGMEIPKSIIYPDDEDLRYDVEVLGEMLRDAKDVLCPN